VPSLKTIYVVRKFPLINLKNTAVKNFATVYGFATGCVGQARTAPLDKRDQSSPPSNSFKAREKGSEAFD
jgi:hypothetical protein